MSHCKYLVTFKITCMLFRVTKEGAFLLFLLPYMKLWRPNCRRNHLVLAYFILAYRSSVQQRRLHKRIREMSCSRNTLTISIHPHMVHIPLSVALGSVHCTRLILKGNRIHKRCTESVLKPPMYFCLQWQSRKCNNNAGKSHVPSYWFWFSQQN